MEKLTQKTRNDKIKTEKKVVKSSKNKCANEIKTKQNNKNLSKKTAEIQIKQSSVGVTKSIMMKTTNQYPGEDKSISYSSTTEQEKPDAICPDVEVRESGLTSGKQIVGSVKDMNANHTKDTSLANNETRENYQQLKETNNRQRSLFQEKQKHMQQQQQKMIMKLKQEKAEL